MGDDILKREQPLFRNDRLSSLVEGPAKSDAFSSEALGFAERRSLCQNYVENVLSVVITQTKLHPRLALNNFGCRDGRRPGDAELWKV